MKSFARLIITLGLFVGVFTTTVNSADKLESGFKNPPTWSRPWVYWFPLSGNITSNGITLDLEAMKRAGIGGVLYMETEQGTPYGPANFAGTLWRNLFKHICSEANRLGLDVNMNNDAGWCGSGGPWITPELSMQKIVWSEINVNGPKQFDAVLPQPPTVKNYYEDIAVFAFPTPEKNYTIPNLRGKSAETVQEIPLKAVFPKLPSEVILPRHYILNLTDRLVQGGRLIWNAPAGKWTILRIGHTTTGKDNHPAPVDGRGLECDKLSKQGAEAAFNGLMAKLIQDSKPLVGEKKTLVSTHIDSWEVGSQNWTPKFREEFQRLRGYDPLPYLPVMAGRVVDSLEISERFLWDVRMTVNDLLIENYAGHFRTLARKNGIRLSIEAYGEPADDLTYAGRADEPMGEFWSWPRFGSIFSCTEMVSAAHIYGKQIIGAEAFTATDAEKWMGHPGNIKDIGDWAFCEGINRFVFHRYALQPWTDARPGMSMGPWGLHYERTQTWWEQSRAWHEYLARCQFLLQQGRFIADLCFLAPETSPQSFKSPVKSGFDRPGYNFDGCPPEAVLTRMKVKNGNLVLPEGQSYRMLVLPLVDTMTPKLLRKIRDLVADGAIVVGAPPIKSPSLSGYPKCDEEVHSIAQELWGTGIPPAEPTARSFGKGKIIWGGAFKPKSIATPEEENPLTVAKWIWRKEGNPTVAVPPGKRYFRCPVVVDNQIDTAQLFMTVDNSFECWVNGKYAGDGDNFNRIYTLSITPFLKPGTNWITVSAVNGADSPNPAGLIALLKIKYRNGRAIEIPSDSRWEASEKAGENWQISLDGNWTAAMELGPLGIAPWGDLAMATTADPTPDINLIAPLLSQMGVPPDFSSQTKNPAQGLRYIHRVIGDTDIYFVANKNPQPENVVCSFRISGRRPELWYPYTGHIESAAVYDADGSITRVPIQLEPYGSVFVVFRKGATIEQDRIISVSRNGVQLFDATAMQEAISSAADAENSNSITLARQSSGSIEAAVSQSGKYIVKTANGNSQSIEVATLPNPIDVEGSWHVHFTPNWGAPEYVTFDKLISWSTHSNPGVRYFSGAATYKQTINIPADWVAKDRRLCLDLGKVAVIAEVKLNGKDLGILWKAPFTVDITSAAKPGDNALEVKVVNLWINRQIGDEQLPEDSDRNPNGTLKSWPKWLQEGKSSPTGRYTFTSWRLWKKDDPLVESGLLGPVQLHLIQTVKVKL